MDGKVEINHQDEEGNRITDFATYDPIREGKAKLDRQHAKLLFNVKFIPFDPQLLHQGLSYGAVVIYGFIEFFTSGGKYFFVTDSQLATFLNCSKETIKRQIKELKTHNLIQATHKIIIGKGTVRKIRVIKNDHTEGSILIPGSVKNDHTGGSRMTNNSYQDYSYQEIHNISSYEDKDESLNANTGILKEDKPQTSQDTGYGDPEINQMLSSLREALSLPDFSESRNWQRIYAKQLVRVAHEVGKEEFLGRLDVIVNDSFKRRNCNSLKYLYGQIKSTVSKPQGGIPQFESAPWRPQHY